MADVKDTQAASSVTPPTSYKAWVVVKNGDPRTALQLQDVAAPSGGLEKPPTGSNVRVRVTHAALNPADLQFLQILPTWIPFRRRATPGLDFAGEVVAVGPSVPIQGDDAVAVGTRVCGCMSVPLVATGHGALAQYVTVPAHILVKQPLEGWAADPAAAVGVLGVAGQTAHLATTDPSAEILFQKQAQKQKSSQSGEETSTNGPRVLVNGASGGVGSLIVQIAKSRGASLVVGICSSANAVRVQQQLGADLVIDYADPAHQPLPTYLASQFGSTDSEQNKNQNRNFDLIFDCVGDDALYHQSASYLQPRGAFLTIVGGNPLESVYRIARNGLLPRILGGTPRLYKLLALGPSGAQGRAVAAWVANGTIKSMPVDSTYNIDEAVTAYEKLATKRAKGKIVIKLE